MTPGTSPSDTDRAATKAAGKKAAANKLGALALALTDAMAEGFDALSSSAAAAVLILRREEALATTDLARLVGLSQPACTRMIDRLVADGLAERRAARGRVVPVALTPKGRRLGELIQARRLAVLRGALDALDKKERKEFERLLDKALTAVMAGDRPSATPHPCRLCEHALCRSGTCPGRPDAELAGS